MKTINAPHQPMTLERLERVIAASSAYSIPIAKIIIGASGS